MMRGLRRTVAHGWLLHVRFGSKADICSALSDVRFTPESGMRSAKWNVRFGPKADIAGVIQEFHWRGLRRS
jgi:hypothetical protein